MFGRHKSRDDAAELAEAARKALDDAMKSAGAGYTYSSYGQRSEQVWLEEPSIEISLVDLEHDEREAAAVMVEGEVWERFERLRGDRVEVEVVARRQDRGTRLTRRGSSR